MSLQDSAATAQRQRSNSGCNTYQDHQVRELHRPAPDELYSPLRYCVPPRLPEGAFPHPPLDGEHLVEQHLVGLREGTELLYLHGPVY
jgi:hypothetical protein